MTSQNQTVLGWGIKAVGGAEIWDDNPVFVHEKITMKDRLKLLFYPKKWMLYRYIEELRNHEVERLRVLDVGCGTGAALVDLKKLFGRSADVIGVDVVKLQVELANEKIRKNGVWAEAVWYNGEYLPFPDASFDAIYTSDVLGHVQDVRAWLAELCRVLKRGGRLAMFAESKLGRHAWIRNYLLERGLNIDPHADFHVSLYGKQMLREFLDAAGFGVKKMYSSFWAKFVLHPEDFYRGFDSDNHKFIILRTINRVLYWLKKRLHPYSTALCELCGLAEMLTIGRWAEGQGYIVLAEKK